MEWVQSFLETTFHPVSDKMLDIISIPDPISVNLDSNSSANTMASPGYFL